MANKTNSAAAEKKTNEPKAAVAPKTKKEELYELAHKDTGFYDAETGFQIVRDQQKPLGETVGNATNLAIQSGRLLIVKSKSKAAAETTDEEDEGSDETTDK